MNARSPEVGVGVSWYEARECLRRGSNLEEERGRGRGRERVSGSRVALPSPHFTLRLPISNKTRRVVSPRQSLTLYKQIITGTTTAAYQTLAASEPVTTLRSRSDLCEPAENDPLFPRLTVNAYCQHHRRGLKGRGRRMFDCMCFVRRTVLETVPDLGDIRIVVSQE